MSRCFPFPPPSYVANWDSPLIGSIKIEKEKTKLKQDKNEQKRTGKERKKKENLKTVQNNDGTLKRKRHCDGYKNLVNGALKKMKVEPEAEQLERSSLTEEYGHPIVSDSSSYSSDGTQSKTKKITIEQSPSNGSCISKGKVIRFKLKQREPVNALSTDNQPSTSGRTGDPRIKQFGPVLWKDAEYVTPTQNEQFTLNASSANKDRCSFPKPSSPSKKVSRPKSAYEALFSDWVPSIDAKEVNDNEESWLLPKKKQTTQERAILKSCNVVSGQQNASAWACARLLPELDLFVLPYAVPF